MPLDEVTGKPVVFTGGVLAAFDPTVREWEILYEALANGPAEGGPDFGTILTDSSPLLVFDSANDRLIKIGGTYHRGGTDIPATDVWAFDTSTAEWIELLPTG